MKNFIKAMMVLMLVMTFAFVPYSGPKQSEVEANVANRLGVNISKVISHPDLQGSLVGISIRDAKNGKVIYTHNGDTRLRPASNMKLLTGAQALQILGENYRFSTEVLTDGIQKGNVLKGNLFLKGKGDPTLLEKDFNDLASSLKKKGIKTILGDLVADDTWYDSIRHAVDVPWSDEHEYYGAQISALTASPNSDFDAGTVIIEVKPGDEAGDKPEITVTPRTSYVQVHNNAVTESNESKKTLKMNRKHGTNQIYIDGNLPLKSSGSKTWISVWEPTGYALDLFRIALHKQGIKITGDIQTGTTPVKAKLLAVDNSDTLAQVMIPFMKLSNNTIAEGIVKEIGRVKAKDGSWEKGLEILEDQYKTMGITEKSIMMRDGSGLSHVDLISANALTSLLFNVQDDSWFPSYLNSLPVAGNSDRMIGGTLRNRMVGTAAEGKVIAKTGTITSVSTLSGYVNTKSGEHLVFSIMINNVINEKNLKKIEDQLMVILAEY